MTSQVYFVEAYYRDKSKYVVCATKSIEQATQVIQNIYSWGVAIKSDFLKSRFSRQSDFLLENNVPTFMHTFIRDVVHDAVVFDIEETVLIGE